MMSLGTNAVSRPRRLAATIVAVLIASGALAGCTADQPDESEPTAVPTGITPETGTAHAAIITDYGGCDDGEREVAAMVTAWTPRIVVTAGDNTQGVAGCVPFQQSVGDYFGSFVVGPDGAALYPVPGNHDYEDEGAGEEAYLSYFSYLEALTDHPLWYEVESGNVNFFMLDSELVDDRMTQQRDWLRESLGRAQDEEPGDWNVVILHRPPFTSGPHEANTAMTPEAGWDYHGWGADLVVSGHQHVFEHLVVDGEPYVVAGVGASGLVRPCPTPLVSGSQGCVEGYGAVLLSASDTTLTVDYRTPDGAQGRTLRTVEITRKG